MSLPLDDALRQCARHAKRMEHAAQRIAFPIRAEQAAWQTETLNRTHGMSRQLVAWLNRLTTEALRRSTP